RSMVDSPPQAPKLHPMTTLWPLTTPWRVGAVIAFVAFVYGVTTLSDHGVTFDAPSLYYAGDRTLYWLQNPSDRAALNLDQPPPPYFASDYRPYPVDTDPIHYPVFPGLICAVTNWIFHTEIGVLNSIDGHQLGLVLLHAIGLYLFCIYS